MSPSDKDSCRLLCTNDLCGLVLLAGHNMTYLTAAAVLTLSSCYVVLFTSASRFTAAAVLPCSLAVMCFLLLQSFVKDSLWQQQLSAYGVLLSCTVCWCWQAKKPAQAAVMFVAVVSYLCLAGSLLFSSIRNDMIT